MQISKHHKILDKKILVYKIDVEKRTVEELQIKNSLEYIKKQLDFYNYEEFLFNSENSEILILGKDKDYEENNTPYTIKGIDDKFYGNGILVRFSPSNDNENLQSVRSALSLLKSVVNF